MKKLAMRVLIICTIAVLSIPSSIYAQQLLSPAKLKSWIDNGYIDDLGRRVVVLDTGIDFYNPPFFDQRAIYDTGHIPGAYYVPASLLYGGYGVDPITNIPLFRTDGHIKVYGLVPYGPLMDFIVQNFGIERGTALVFTGSEVWNTTRAYWVFRYWGFKKNQLFILNGEANGYSFQFGQPPGSWRSVWEDAGYELETSEPPPPIPSTFSVSECPGNMDAVRASTEEFFLVAEGAIPNTVVIDSRTELDWNAIIPIPGWNETHVFAFRVKNSIWLAFDEFFVETPSGAHVFKSQQDIGTMFQTKGITESMVPYSFCRDGGWATVNFFVYDAILGRSAKIHDGSSIELAQLGHLPDPGGTYIGLPMDSPWRFDQDKYCDIINYNDPNLAQQPTIADAYAPIGNLVNEEDKTYYIPLPDIPVYVDIKPGSCPNSMRLKCTGVLPVAVLGTDQFNVMDIDPDAIRLTREGVVGVVPVAPIRHSYEDVATPFEGYPCDCHTKRKDGLMDLTLKFMVSELVDGLKLNEVAGEDVPLILTGLTNDCNPIRGEDCIVTLGDLKQECHSDLDCDADVDGSDAAMFKEEFGRRNCFRNNPCIADFQVDGDVDGSDALTFKSEFGTILRW